MPYNLLPTPENPRVGEYDLYQIELPADENWRAILIGALTFSADDESYQKRGKLPVDDLGIPAIAAYCISTLERAMTEPLGTLKFCTFSNDAEAPDNWLKCDGQLVSLDDYPGVVNIPAVVPGPLGLYQIPDYREKNLRGLGDSQGVNQLIGADEHTLSVAQMPRHRHSQLLRAPATISVEPGVPITVSGTGVGFRDTGQSGGNEPHNNIPLSFLTDVWMVVK